MMATTHALIALFFAIPVAVVVPAFGAAAAFGALVGGILPDIDLIRGMDHRRHLHFPDYGVIPAAIAAAAALIAPGTLTVFIAFLLGGAWLHARTDMYGGGLEPRPWEPTSDKAVFSHRKQVWLSPRRIVQYDGAPEDLLVATVAAVPSLFVFGDVVQSIITVMLVLSTVYVVIRKPIESSAIARRVEPFILGTSDDGD